MKRLSQDVGGGTAAEFALVLPLLILLLFGIIDAGRLMWTYNRAEKAAQMGARFAAVTDMVPSTLKTQDFTTNGIPGGSPVPTSAFSSTTCGSAGPCSGGWGYDSTAFGNVVTRMNLIMPQVTAGNVQIRYENVGLGFAGDPNGPDVAPLITVSLSGIQFRTMILFGGTITLPTVTASLTGEDMDGNVSN